MKDVTIIIGSENDKPILQPLEEKLTELNISFETFVLSAHRNLPELLDFLKQNKTKIYITAAGLSAALPGVVASQVKEPVIGVPLVVGELSGIDALLSILQLPKGVPVATMGIGKQGLINAALLAKRILDQIKSV
ncbi:MAG TPA: 5-(carboxyamino)imidazole ribonucleotide mutase [Spirochaetota bacterium]|nr:5-(carboxyamino)imidazole ribonucleotide mutase [Spirochaetota bacterium]HOL57973.1 5-(carboxyamino)imidazole ribonucleotide mutase [Spirochaetota bacterium]HPP05512.1 5-(carboxyamino)imidazole ribonucleotide mutase [Spirochaetota bacterium]